MTALDPVLDEYRPRDADELTALTIALDRVLFAAGKIGTHDGNPPPEDLDADALILIVGRIRRRGLEALGFAATVVESGRQ